MPSKKRKYNARFPPGRIKKIMQTDEDIGKVAQAVPVLISRTLELFVESLLTKAQAVTTVRNAKTLTPSHMKQCILSEHRFDFLKDLVNDIPDTNNDEYTSETKDPDHVSHSHSSSPQPSCSLPSTSTHSQHAPQKKLDNNRCTPASPNFSESMIPLPGGATIILPGVNTFSPTSSNLRTPIFYEIEDLNRASDVSTDVPVLTAGYYKEINPSQPYSP